MSSTDILGQVIEEAVERGVQRALANLPATQPDRKRLLSLKSAAEYLDCSPARVQNLIAMGELAPVKMPSDGGAANSKVYVRIEDLEKLVDRCTRGEKQEEG